MIRWVAVVGILGLVIAGIVLLASSFGTGLHTTATAQSSSSEQAAPASVPPAPAPPLPRAPHPIGQLLVAANQRTDGPAEAPAPGDMARQAPPIVIPNARLTALDTQDVPSQHDGQILVIGTELKPGEEGRYPKDMIIEAKVGFIGREIKPEEEVLDNRAGFTITQVSLDALRTYGLPNAVYAKLVDLKDKLAKQKVMSQAREEFERQLASILTVEELARFKNPIINYADNGKWTVQSKEGPRCFRPWKEGEPLEPGRLYVDTRPTKKYRRLKEGDRVEEGQLLAIVDPALVLDELGIKEAKYVSADADWRASVKTRDEAEQRFRTLERLRRQDPRAVPDEEFRSAQLTWDRYFFEEVSKRQAIDLAKRELSQAITQLTMHEIRSKIPGEVKTILKHRGEAVRNLEPVFQLFNPNVVRIEGMTELQNLDHIPKGSTVAVEPSHPERPIQELTGHLQEVNAVAVTNDKDNPEIVSVSEDGTLRVWNLVTRPERIFAHPGRVPIRSVSCTPPGAYANLCMSGGADGTGILWKLDKGSGRTSWELADRHRGAINCIAFSPDGRSCVTAGEDRQIRLWDTSREALEESGGKVKMRYNFEGGHRGRVTWVQFTPDSHLVSAGGDNSLLYWKVGADAAQLESMRFDQRSGEVTAPGVSPDGKSVLYDQGKELRVLSLADGHTEGVLQNPGSSINFTTMAQFSPDGKMILTAAASEARLQLWRAPENQARAYEIRQLVRTALPSPATCCAFSPEGIKEPFVVAGLKDRQVVVWPLPEKEELTGDKIKATVTRAERSLESSSRQVRIWAELNDPKGKLVLGTTATMVAHPKK